MRVILGKWRPALAVRLLVLLLVPVVVFSTPTSAQAASVRWGETADANIRESWGPNGTGSWADCAVVAYWQLDGSALSVKGSVQCATGFAVASLSLPSVTFAGPGCSAEGGIGAELDGIGSPTSFIVGPASSADCNFDRVCVEASYRTHGSLPWSDNASWDSCVPIAVGGPESTPLTGQCVNGEVTGAATVTLTPGQPSAGYTSFTVNMPRNSVNMVTGATNSNARARYVVFARNASGQVVVLLSGNTPVWTGTATSVTSGYTSGTWQQSQVVGVSLAMDYPTSLGWRNGQNWNLSAIGNGSDTAMGGVTWLERCAWYFGEKIANRPADGYDEPASPLGTPPGGLPGNDVEPTPVVDPPSSGDGCNFSVTDPSTWATAGICQLVEMFRSLIDAVLGLPGAILGGLQALFVPDAGVLEAEVDGVRAAWEDSTVGNYMAPFQEADLAVPASGCAGPTVAFSIKGKDVSWEPLNACSGAVATLASLAKLFVTVLVGFFGGLACVRAVGAGFGWRPGVAE